MTSLLIAFLLSATPADSVADLRAVLATLQTHAPVRASLDYAFESTEGDDDAPVVTRGGVTLDVQDGPAGLTLVASRKTLDAAAAEARQKAADARHQAPTRAALSAMSADEVGEALDAAEPLLRMLEHATLQGDSTELRDGQPARKLVLALAPALSEQEKKYVKHLEATLVLWLGSDGVPLAAERKLSVSGRAFLVISFEQKELETLRYVRHGGRLVTVERIRDSSGSGGGERGKRHSEQRLTLQ